MKQNPGTKTINILREIEGNKILPVYLLCGNEAFLIEGMLKQMLDKLLSPESRDFNLTVLDGNIVSVREILSNVDLYPVMSEWRVVVVENFPAFRTQNKTSSPTTVIRNAMQIENENAQKCVVDIAKFLTVSTQQIADQHADFNSAIDEIGEKLGAGLTEDVRSFFTRLPQLASKLETHSDSNTNNDNVDLMLEWLQGELPKSSVLIFLEKNQVSEKNRFAKEIQSVGRYVAFNALEKASSINRDPLYKKITEKFATFDKKITPRAFEQLRNRTGGDMQLISEAINKIINFVGEKQQIDEHDVRNLVTQTTYDQIFDITDAIGKRSTRQAIKSLREVIASGMDPIPVTAAIANHLRFSLQAKLITIKKDMKPIGRQLRFPDFSTKIFQPLAQEMGDLLPNSATSNILKRNPYIAYKLFQTLNSFTAEELMTALEKTLDINIQLKTTPFDGEEMLEQLVYDICNSSKQR